MQIKIKYGLFDMNKNNTLTQSQLFRQCEKNKYILCRTTKNKLYGLNCSIIKTTNAKLFKTSEVNTAVVSIIPCDFNTYINYKLPFC